MLRFLVLLVCLFVSTPVAHAQSASSPTAEGVRSLLHSHFDVAGWLENASPYDTTWSAFGFTTFNLGGSSQPELVVHLVGGDWCGANGPCHVLVFTMTSCGYQPVGQFRMNMPVYALASSTNGWRDLAGTRDGDFDTPARLVALSFDGAEYDNDLWRSAIREFDRPPSNATLLLMKSADHNLVMPGRGALNKRGGKSPGCPVS